MELVMASLNSIGVFIAAIVLDPCFPSIRGEKTNKRREPDVVPIAVGRICNAGPLFGKDSKLNNKTGN
jgi:hypothetical protein